MYSEFKRLCIRSATNNSRPSGSAADIRNVLEDTVDVESYFSCSSPSPAEEVRKPKELSVSHLKLTDLILQSSVTVFKAKPLVLGLIPAVIKMLKCHHTLKELDLTKSSVNDDYCLPLAEALDGAQLSRLLLGQNSITSIGISNLVKCLPPSLKVLDLSCNCLNPEGVAAVADVLHRLHALETLHLNRVNMGSVGAFIVGTALEKIAQSGRFI
ncbi:hypothetical protein GEMRC1_004265 [Eukaryota sp. GEM-RC1]